MLPINFHKTFVPERRLIAALLNYAALGKAGDFQTIAAETGIPTGRSTGKVPAIIDYARGMGLIVLEKGRRDGIKKPVLTPMGRAVFSHDKYLSEEMTQWLCHMNLCRSDIGGTIWHLAFAKGRSVLGSTFSRQQLENYLTGVIGPGNNRTGPVIRTYVDDAALGRTGAIKDVTEGLARGKAPILDAYASPYSAFILGLIEAYFPGQRQVTFTDFGEKTLWFDVCLWNESDIERAFSIIERKGFIAIDRQMRPWILDVRAATADVWPHIYEDLA